MNLASATDLLVIVASLPFAIFLFVITKKSVYRLRTKVLDYYPFTVFLPGTRVWSALYLMVMIALFSVILFLASKLDVPLLPA